MPILLVIDDEPAILFSIEQCLKSDELEVLSATTAEEGLRLLAEHSPEVVMLDIRLGDRSGLDLFQTLRGINPQALVIFITGHGTADTAIEAMKLGAYDYLVKPLDIDLLRQSVAQALVISRMTRVPAIVDESDRPETRPDRLVGSGPMLQAAFKQIGRVAPQDVSVLILGESGTGKELVARAIYHHSRRKNAPFLAINCAAIPESLLESELFGHERGAFTGADRRRIGKFEQCQGGTLFLDEVGDMALGTQAKILRLLQERCLERLGGSQTIPIDVRLIAATNQDLDALIQQGRFRADLLYRLRGVTIRMPPLRQHREDIAELAHYFLFRFNRQFGTSVHSIAPEALELMEQHDWPGNVRELESVIREALIASAGTTLLPEFLPEEIRLKTPAAPASEAMAVPDMDWQAFSEFVEQLIAQGEGDVYRRAVEQFDRLVIARAMRQADGQQNRAARLLGLSRVTLRAKLRAMEMGVEKVLTPRKPTEPDPP